MKTIFRTPAIALLASFACFGSTRAAEGVLTDDTNFSAGQFLKTTAATKGAMAVKGSTIGLVQFDVSNLPAGTAALNIQQATLHLFVNKAASSGSFGVRRVLDGWDEANSISAAPPTFVVGAEPQAISAPLADEYVVIDLTELVRAWVSGSVPNHGVALVANAGSKLKFNSKESSDGKPPRLEIELKQNVVRMFSKSGAGSPPGENVPSFLGEPAIVTITNSINQVHVTSTSVIGNGFVVNGKALATAIGFRPQGQKGTPSVSAQLVRSMPALDLAGITHSAVLENLAPGTYEICITGRTDDPSAFTALNFGSTTSVIVSE